MESIRSEAITIKCDISKEEEKADMENNIQESKENMENIVKSSNQFALDFYSNIKKEEEGNNIFFSPYSIFTALVI